MTPVQLRVGQVAVAAGVTLETLLYDERRGCWLVRTQPEGYRLYPSEVVRRLRVIKTAERLGFTLAERAEPFEAGTHRHGVGRRPAGLQARAADKLAEVEQEIGDLGFIRNTPLQALNAGCDDLVT